MASRTSIPSVPFGQLFLVATPIGNMKDITLRALEILKFVDLVAAEDTRRSKILLQHYGLSKPLLSLHAHNEDHRIAQILEKLQEGLNIALISDAGTPLISDPGFTLVQKIRQENMTVIPIPGSCALIAALSASGLPCDQFFFAGFLPAQSSARKKSLKVFEAFSHTVIFYEAPHRILALFKDMLTIYGNERKVAFAKEITKIFEHFFLGTIEEAITWLTSVPEHQKGEFVVMLSGVPVKEIQESASLSTENILKILLKTLPLKQAVQVATEMTGEKKNKVYALALTV
jgi:16S rRNA (cytidine1402-2'-O)-methyltransferase